MVSFSGDAVDLFSFHSPVSTDYERVAHSHTHELNPSSHHTSQSSASPRQSHRIEDTTKMKAAIAMIVALAACLLSASHGLECSKSSLSQAAQEQLDIYNKDLYLEPACVDGTVPLPVHCNYMGLGQECRGCYMTCAGALKYMDDFPQEIANWGVDAIIHFCPSSDVDSIDHC